MATIWKHDDAIQTLSDLERRRVTLFGPTAWPADAEDVQRMATLMDAVDDAYLRRDADAFDHAAQALRDELRTVERGRRFDTADAETEIEMIRSMVAYRTDRFASPACQTILEVYLEVAEKYLEDRDPKLFRVRDAISAKVRGWKEKQENS